MGIIGAIPAQGPILSSDYLNENADDGMVRSNSGAGGLAQINGVAYSQPLMDLSRFTTWGVGFSVGRFIGSAIRLPGSGLNILSVHAASSEWIIVRGLGAGAEFLGKVIGIIGGISGHAITLGERLLINGLKGMGAATLIIAGVFARPFCNTFLLESGIAMLKDAWMTRGECQEALASEKKRQVAPLARTIENTYFKRLVLGDFCLPDFLKQYLPKHMHPLPDGYAAIKVDDVPEHWRPRCDPIGSTSDGPILVYGLSVPVSLNRGPDDKIIIAFGGVSSVGSAGSALLGAFGVADSTFNMAADLVQDLASRHSGNVHVIGHSLGGALAQYAGIKANVSVTCFNAMGLTAQLADELADLAETEQRTLTTRHVEHINSVDDWLSQKLQTRYLPFGLSQLGRRYKDQEAEGHLISAFD